MRKVATRVEQVCGQLCSKVRVRRCTYTSLLHYVMLDHTIKFLIWVWQRFKNINKTYPLGSQKIQQLSVGVACTNISFTDVSVS